MERVRAEGRARPMCHYEISSLAKNSFRVVTVNLYNPHVKDEEVRAFLGRYMDNVSSARLLRDSLGFWNGRRGFQALLREDPKGLGGYLHPPAMFSLGADRGTLYYARQPPFCRRCMAYGHTLALCSTRKCRFCGSSEHEAKDCVEPKACHGCGSLVHLWRDCPVRQRSYASAAGGGAGDGGRRGGDGDPDPSTGPEGTGTMQEQEKKAAAGEEVEKEGMGAVETDGEEGLEEKGGRRVEKPMKTAAEKETKKALEAGQEGEEGKEAEGDDGGDEAEKKETVIEEVEEGAVTGQKGEAGKGDSEVSSARVEEMRGMVEELAGRGDRDSPLPFPPPDKKIRVGTVSRGRRDGGTEGVARQETKKGEVAGPLLVPSSTPLLLLTEMDLSGMAVEGGPCFLFEGTGSSVKSSTEGKTLEVVEGGKKPRAYRELRRRSTQE
uniref:CCHC-type domain-containing protein n=1 Tax=Hucho hucho TaxID=62062 RepID=A0A4W5MAQ1_9TELE